MLKSQSLVTGTDIRNDAGAPWLHDCWRSFEWENLCVQSAGWSPWRFVRR